MADPDPGADAQQAAQSDPGSANGTEDGSEPIPPELVRAAVLAARDEADLRERLAALVPQADPRFQQALERASYAAAVLGYVAADEQRA